MKFFVEPFIGNIAKEVSKCTLCIESGYLCKIHAQIVTTNIIQSSNALLIHPKYSTKSLSVWKNHTNPYLQTWLLFYMVRKFPVVLLVDDSDAFRIFCRDAIKDSIKFIQILEAKDGLEGLKQYQLHKPDMILLDLKMPKIEGEKVLELIRKNDKITKIIVTSAYNRDQESINNLIKMGANSYVPKPMNRINLMKVITDVLAIGKKPGTNFTKSLPAS